MRVLAVCLVLIQLSPAQMVQQCTCSEWNPCLQKAPDSVQQCADRCQKHISAMGASYPMVRQCILTHVPQIQQAYECVQRNIGQSCALTAGIMVPKRYPETMQFAAFREINTMLAASGIQSEASGLMSVGRKSAGCMMKCISVANGGCLKRLKCGLALPSDNTMVQIVKQCAIAAGFNTATVRSICNCLTNAGIRQLSTMCPRITIQ